MLTILKAVWVPGYLIVLVACIALGVAALGGGAYSQPLTEALIRIVAVVALYIFVGNSGIVSFGHAGFMAIGAYACAWFTVRTALKPLMFPALPDVLKSTSIPAVPAALIAGILVALVALMVGYVILRLSGLAASIASFAVLVIVQSIYSNWDSMTGGLRSIIGIPRSLTTYSALGWAAFTIAVAYAYQRSRRGRSLRASRDDEVAALAAGVDVFRERLIAFVLSGFFSGLAGALMASQVGSLSIAGFWLDLTFLLLVMLVVGGMGSLTGAVGGVVVVSGIVEFLRALERGVTVGSQMIKLAEGAQQFGLSILILLVLIRYRRGLFGWAEWRFPAARDESG
jgi:branched-chain amino acid transport system permease protein